MRPSQVEVALKAAIKTGKPMFIKGEPGIGKSRVVAKVAHDLGRLLYDVRCTLLDPIDLRGVPSVAEGRTRWNPPIFMPNPGPSILFLDELPNAAMAVQSALLQLVLDRRLGEYELPTACAIVAAGNRVQDRAGSSRLITSLASRFVQINFEVSHPDWLEWAYDRGIQPEVIAYLRFQAGDLNAFPEKNEAKVDAWPNPRGWENVSDLLPELAREVELEMVSGIIGEGTATKFIAFRRTWRDMPDLDEILAHPKKAPIPKDLSTKYAVCVGLAHKIPSGQDGPSLLEAQRIAGPVLQYAERLEEEFGVMLWQDAARQNKLGVAHAPEFAQWAIKHASVLTSTGA